MSISGNSKSTARSMVLPRSIERYFIYDFEKGCIKVHFGSADRHKIKINVHKTITVDEDMRASLQAYSDQEDTYHREKDMNYVRSVFKIYFDQIQAEAEEEIRLAQLDTSGVAICTHIRNFQVPDGYELVKRSDFVEIQDDCLDMGVLSGGVHAFPMNYGAIVRRTGDTTGRLEFHCQSNEKCRNEKCVVRLNLQVPTKITRLPASVRMDPPKVKSDDQLAEEHLREKHWNLVLQYQ